MPFLTKSLVLYKIASDLINFIAKLSICAFKLNLLSILTQDISVNQLGVDFYYFISFLCQSPRASFRLENSQFCVRYV